MLLSCNCGLAKQVHEMKRLFAGEWGPPLSRANCHLRDIFSGRGWPRVLLLLLWSPHYSRGLQGRRMQLCTLYFMGLRASRSNATDSDAAVEAAQPHLLSQEEPPSPPKINLWALYNKAHYTRSNPGAILVRTCAMLLLVQHMKQQPKRTRRRRIAA